MTTKIQKTTSPFNVCDPEFVYSQLDNSTAPVDLEEICEKLNITIRRDMPIKMLGYNGAIWRKNGKTTIWINPADSHNRQRFTLAHEIGHYVKHFMQNRDDLKMRDDLTKFRKEGLWDNEEYEANQYAASLLMPRALISEEMEKLFKTNPQSIGEVIDYMSNKFEVSRESMKYRLNRLYTFSQ